MKREQMPNIENYFEIKRPATRNNSAHIQMIKKMTIRDGIKMAE